MKFIKIIFFTFLILSNQQIFNMTIFGKGSYIDYIAQIEKLVNDAQKNVLDNYFKTFEDNNKRINDIIDIIEKYATNEIQNSAPLRAYFASKNFFPKGDKNIYGDIAKKNAITNFKTALNSQRDVLLDKLKEIYKNSLEQNNIIVPTNIIKWAKTIDNNKLNNLLKNKKFNQNILNLENVLQKINPWQSITIYNSNYQESNINIPITTASHNLSKQVKVIIYNELKEKYLNLLPQDIFFPVGWGLYKPMISFDITHYQKKPLQYVIKTLLEFAIINKDPATLDQYIKDAKTNNTINRQNPLTGRNALITTLIWIPDNKRTDKEILPFKKLAISKLLDAGADPFIEDNDKKTFFDYLKDIKDEKYKKEIEQIVKEHQNQIKANLPEVLPKEMQNIIADYLI